MPQTNRIFRKKSTIAAPQQRVNVFARFFGKISEKFQIFIPLRLRIVSVTPFYVRHAFFHVQNPLAASQSVAELDQPVVIVVFRFFRQSAYFERLAFGYIDSADVYIEVSIMPQDKAIFSAAYAATRQ